MHKALENEGYLHGSLLLAALNHVWKTKSMDDCKLPILHHKQQAYKFVAQHLKNPNEAAADTVVATVGTLALLEAALWEVSSSTTSTKYALEAISY